MDDDDMVRDVARGMLNHLGYEVLLAGDGAEAIRLYQRARDEGTPVDAVILDLTIPGGMGGLDTLKLLKEKNPAVVAIVTSGYSNDPVMANYRDYGFVGAIKKPFKVEDVAGVLRAVPSGARGLRAAGQGSG